MCLWMKVCTAKLPQWYKARCYTRIKRTHGLIFFAMTQITTWVGLDIMNRCDHGFDFYHSAHTWNNTPLAVHLQNTKYAYQCDGFVYNPFVIWFFQSSQSVDTTMLAMRAKGTSSLLLLRSTHARMPAHTHLHTQNWCLRRLYQHNWRSLNLECVSKWQYYPKSRFWTPLLLFLWIFFRSGHLHSTPQNCKWWVCMMLMTFNNSYLKNFGKSCSASKFFHITLWHCEHRVHPMSLCSTTILQKIESCKTSKCYTTSQKAHAQVWIDGENELSFAKIPHALSQVFAGGSSSCF